MGGKNLAGTHLHDASVSPVSAVAVNDDGSRMTRNSGCWRVARWCCQIIFSFSPRILDTFSKSFSVVATKKHFWKFQPWKVILVNTLLYLGGGFTDFWYVHPKILGEIRSNLTDAHIFLFRSVKQLCNFQPLPSTWGTPDPKPARTQQLP